MSAPVPIPGTVHLVDLDGKLRNLRHGKGDREIVLVPQPSNNPDDPLNWSPRRKLLSSTAQFVYIFVAAIATSCLSPALGLMVADTGIPLANINTGTGVMYLFMGWSNLIVQSVALNYGRRPVLLASAIVAGGLALWTSYVRSTTEWYLNRILMGIAVSPVETLVEITFSDVQFSHVRGFYLAIYNWALWNIPFVAPIASGFVAQRYGWQWIQFIVTILVAACCIFLFFFLEETMFYRPHLQEEFMDEIIDDGNTVSVGKEAATGAAGQGEAIDERNLPTPGAGKDASTVVTTQGRDMEKNVATETFDIAIGDVYSRKTYVQKLKLWGLRDPRQPNTVLQDMYLPFILVRFPAIIFGGLLVGGSLSWFNVVNGTIALILGGPPYNFSANMIGVSCISCVIGISLGCFFAGWLSDKLAIRMARRNNGVREPEHRLWMAFIPLLLHPAGCILYGVGAFNTIPWVGITFGLGFIAACLPMGANVAFNYVLDSYKEVGGQAIVTTILFRNTMGFGFVYAVVPMIDNLGLQNTFILLGFIGMGFWAMCFFMLMFGKRIRASNASVYWHLVEKRGAVLH